MIRLNTPTTKGSVSRYATTVPARKSAVPEISTAKSTVFSRAVSAGKTKRKTAKTIKGKASAVPPQSEMEIMAEIPLVKSSPWSIPSQSAAGAFRSARIQGEPAPAAMAQISQAVPPKINMSRSASKCSRSGRSGSLREFALNVFAALAVQIQKLAAEVLGNAPELGVVTPQTAYRLGQRFGADDYKEHGEQHQPLAAADAAEHYLVV